MKCWQPWNGYLGSICNQCKILEQQKKMLDQQSSNQRQSSSGKPPGELFVYHGTYDPSKWDHARLAKEYRWKCFMNFLQDLFMWSMILGILYIVFNPNIH